MKHTLLLVFIISFSVAKSQTVDSIYVNLYTDSLKRGTYNYINIDGQLANGSYSPLDNTQVIFICSAGQFSGNSLWIDKDFPGNKVTIKVTLKQKPSLHKEFDIYIKQKPDGPLKTVDELMSEMKNRKQKKKSE